MICRVLARPRMLPAFHLLPRLPNPARPAAEYDARAFGHRLNCTAQAPDKTSVTNSVEPKRYTLYGCVRIIFALHFNRSPK